VTGVGASPSRALLLAAVALTCAAFCPPAGAAASGERLRVGALVLHRCGAGQSGWCGSPPRPLDPARPSGPKIAIGLRWLPATGRARSPTLVTVEGGPGYPSIGSLAEYHAMFGPLRRTRDLLLVYNRGTGSSELVDCPRLQAFTGVTSGPAFPGIVAQCARRLGRRYRGVHAADLFATAYAAADLDAVLRALSLPSIDLYGDSYGTFFAQSFASRGLADQTTPIPWLDGRQLRFRFPPRQTSTRLSDREIEVRRATSRSVSLSRGSGSARSVQQPVGVKGRVLRLNADLRGMTRREVTVRFVARTKSGRILRDKRVYHLCASA
jgi:hypothetical protein